MLSILSSVVMSMEPSYLRASVTSAAESARSCRVARLNTGVVTVGTTVGVVM